MALRLKTAEDFPTRAQYESRLAEKEANLPPFYHERRRHLFIGTVLALLPILLFWLFRDRLPDMVPMQFRFDGTAGNHIPRDGFIFGLPFIFAGVSWFFSRQFLGDAVYRPWKFYLVPALIWLLSAFILIMTLRGLAV